MSSGLAFIRKGITNPGKAARYLYRNISNTYWNRLYKRPYLLCRTINQRYYSHYHQSGDLDAVTEDWDTLILLDACRHDYFAEVSDLPGSLNSRLAPGSMSLAFINGNFRGRQLHDTVYVTANPFAMEIESGTFHDVISLIDEYYENDIGTVPPEEVSTAAREAHERYPEKRIIVHYMQPHEPFLSEFGQRVSGKLRWQGNQYHLPRELKLQDLHRAYRENVELAVDEVRELLPDIDGKVVVSADHGELLGERLSPIPIRGLEHPAAVYEEALLKVPWLEIERETRRTIESEPPRERDTVASETAEKRLKQLGYF